MLLIIAHGGRIRPHSGRCPARTADATLQFNPVCLSPSWEGSGVSVSATKSKITELVRSFVSAPPNGVDSAYQLLVGAVWSEGKLTDAALDAAPLVVAALSEAGNDRKGHLAVLLGLLAEAEHPRFDGEVATAVRAGLDSYLDLLRGSAGGLDPLTLALVYLVGHFPADRDRVLAVTGGIAMEIEERTRLARALADLDPAHPDLGRAWPAPSVWQLGDEDTAHAEAAVAGLSAEQIQLNWDNDTRTVWAYSGAIAYWAVCNGTPARVAVRSVPEWHPAEQGRTPATDAMFGARGDALRCPTCHGQLQLGVHSAHCDPCATTYLSANGILDLSAGVRDGQQVHEATADLLQKLSEMPMMGLYYENLLRPAYLRMAGSNFGNVVTRAVEDAYVTEQLGDTDGLVVDLAAGAGTWTAVVADTVGADRLIAVDMLLPMLNVLRDRLPDVPTVRATALNLPFGDGTVGAINLWNALQAFPDDAAQAIAEIGRCLRPGGILTMMTYRWSDDPVARYFQASHFFPSRPEGHLLFELEQLHQWLADAGMTVRNEIADRGTFVFVTAERSA
jgi:SAM-dependent methyltransferase